MTHSGERIGNSKKTLSTLLGTIAVLAVGVAVLLNKIVYPIYHPTIDSTDKSLTSYQAFIFPVFVDRNGLIRTLRCYKALPSGGGDYAESDPVSNPWPIVPAPLRFRWNPAAQEFGLVVRREKPDINEPDDRDVRVHWMTAREVQNAIEKGEIVIPNFASLPQFDLSKISR